MMCVLAYLCLGGNDFTLPNTLTLRSHRQRLLQLLAKDNVLDKHTLDLHPPTCRHILNDLANRRCNLLAPLNHVLQDPRSNDMPQRRLRALQQRLAYIGDAKGGNVRRDNVVVYDGGQAQIDIILGHARLLGDLGRLDLDIDLEQLLAQGVDFDKPGIDGLVEASEFGNEADVALVDVFVRVWAAEYEGDGS